MEDINQQIQNGINDYMTKAQYGVTRIQAHTHNGTDSLPVDVSSLARFPSNPSDGDTIIYSTSMNQWLAQPGNSLPLVLFTTDFTAAARYATGTGGATGAVAFSEGAYIESGATANSYAFVNWNLGNSTQTQIFGGNPEFTCGLYISNIPPAANQGMVLFGLGAQSAPSGTAFTLTERHIGFKLLSIGGATEYELHATQADGTTETASAALTTLTASDLLQVCFKVKDTGVDYYWRKNIGDWSSVTTLTTHMPSATFASSSIQWIINNQNTAHQNKVAILSATYKR